MSKQPQIADLCVIGAGPAGFSVAALAAQLGARVVLIERGRSAARSAAWLPPAG